VQTGGVALTLSVAYLSVLTHQRNREQQGAALRAQALALQSLVDPIPEPLPPTRSEAAAAQRAHTVEVAKDRWNHEIENAVHWAQTTDWDAVREQIERESTRLWAKMTGKTPAEEIERAKETAKVKTADVTGGVADAARAAYSKAKAKGLSVEEAAENKALEARLKFEKTATKVEWAAEDKAVEAKGALTSAWASGKDKAMELADKAKVAVGAAESKVEPTADGKILPGASPVEKALHERYLRPEAKVNKTVSEALAERYIPLNARDNTVLRGI
jgi:altered-inheritance-of-mitochondria protein 5